MHDGIQALIGLHPVQDLDTHPFKAAVYTLYASWIQAFIGLQSCTVPGYTPFQGSSVHIVRIMGSKPASACIL